MLLPAHTGTPQPASLPYKVWYVHTYFLTEYFQSFSLDNGHNGQIIPSIQSK